MAKKKAKLSKNDFGFGKAVHVEEAERGTEYWLGSIKIWLGEDEHADVRIRGTIVGKEKRGVHYWSADIEYWNYRFAGYPAPLICSEVCLGKEGLTRKVNADLDQLRSRVKEALEKRRKEREKAKKKAEREKNRPYAKLKAMKETDLKIDHVEEVYGSFLLDGGNGRTLRAEIRHFDRPWDEWKAYVYDCGAKDPAGGQKLLTTIGGSKTAANIVEQVNIVAKEARKGTM